MTIPQITALMVAQSVYIQEALNDGLINVSALAKYLKEDIEKKVDRPVKLGSVIMAINRLPREQETYIVKQVLGFLRKIKNIAIRSDLIDYTYRTSPTLLLKQLELMKKLDGYPDNFFSISRGVYETTLITSGDLEVDLINIFKGEKLVSSKRDLAAAIMMLPPKNTEISGIYYYILKQIAWKGINIVEMISTTNEFTIVVQQQDVNELLKVLMELKNVT